MSDKNYKAMAIFIDSTTTIQGNIPKSATVRDAVGRISPIELMRYMIYPLL